MDLVILPYEGVGDLRFGMTIEEVRAVLGHEWETTDTFARRRCARDYYKDYRLFAEFCYPGKLVSVEMAHPAATLNGKRVLQISFREVHDWILEHDAEARMESGGVTSYAMGVAFYCPDYADYPEDPAEGVLAFERDYYSKDYRAPKHR